MDSPELARRYLDAFVARDYRGARSMLAVLRARVHFVHAEAGERVLEQHRSTTSCDSRTRASRESISSVPVCTRRERRTATAGDRPPRRCNL